MGLSTGSVTNDLEEGRDILLMAAFKTLKRRAILLCERKENVQDEERYYNSYIQAAPGSFETIGSRVFPSTSGIPWSSGVQVWGTISRLNSLKRLFWICHST